MDDLEESVKCVFFFVYLSFSQFTILPALFFSVLTNSSIIHIHMQMYISTKHIYTSRIVEQTGPRMFGLDEAEVVKRRQYVLQVRGELEVRFFYSSSSN